MGDRRIDKRTIVFDHVHWYHLFSLHYSSSIIIQWSVLSSTSTLARYKCDYWWCMQNDWCLISNWMQRECDNSSMMMQWKWWSIMCAIRIDCYTWIIFVVVLIDPRYWSGEFFQLRQSFTNEVRITGRHLWYIGRIQWRIEGAIEAQYRPRRWTVRP